MTVNTVDVFGQQAGNIWQTLYSSGTLSEQKLCDITGLTSDDFHSAVGWLARENKIIKNGSMYTLGETNLTQKIGRDAGKIWHVLDIWGDLDFLSLTRLARIEKEDIFFAIGWLVREGKIEITPPSSEKTSIHLWLK